MTCNQPQGNSEPWITAAIDQLRSEAREQVALHTVIYGDRRMSITGLAEHVLAELGWPDVDVKWLAVLYGYAVHELNNYATHAAPNPEDTDG